jgi:hypothetical protein
MDAEAVFDSDSEDDIGYDVDVVGVGLGEGVFVGVALKVSRTSEMDLGAVFQEPHRMAPTAITKVVDGITVVSASI